MKADVTTLEAKRPARLNSRMRSSVSSRARPAASHGALSAAEADGRHASRTGPL